jgi:Mg-chelatase subunit ChlD
VPLDGAPDPPSERGAPGLSPHSDECRLPVYATALCGSDTTVTGVRPGIRAAAATLAFTAVALPSQPPARGQGTHSAQAAAERASVVLLMDASGSMGQPAGSGELKIEAARAAIGELLDSLSPEIEVGMRVFGGGASGRTGCDDTAQIFPVGPVDPGPMKARLTRYQPEGTTPLGLGLREAAGDLPGSGTRAIVLVSDGRDRCAPPEPCGVAEMIARGGVDLRIEAIGFQVGRADRAQLRCIARAGGGVYHDAEDPEALADSLNAVVSRALRRYRPAGEEVRGTPGADDAPLLAEGQYVDRIRPGQARWYRVDLPEGVGVAAAATLVPPLPRLPVSFRSVGGELTARLFEPEELSARGSQPGIEQVGLATTVDSDFQVGFERDLGGGDPITATVRSGTLVGEETRLPPGVYGVGIELGDNLPQRSYALEVLIDTVGEPVAEEPEPGSGDDDVGTSEEGSDGAGVAAAIAVGLVGATVGFGFAAALGRRRR